MAIWCSLLSEAVRLPWGLPLVLLGLAGLGGAAWLKFRLEFQFYFVDYIHAELRRYLCKAPRRYFFLYWEDEQN